jgi:multicomponent Na+:H+ antiporter subunit D
MTAALGWAVLVPLAAAVAAAVLPGRARAAAGIAASAAALGIALLVAASVLREERPLELEIGGWEAPLGIGLRADGMAASMLVLTGVVGLAASAYAAGYLRPEPGRFTASDGFWPLWLLLLAALNGLFLARDVFNVFVALELVGLSAVGLVFLAGGTAALTGGTRYLLAAWLGSSLYLLGVALAYGAYDVLDMRLLAERADARPAAVVALALMTGGLLLKAALFPLHFWLPRAHASAPPPASAALSGLVVTASFTVVVRLWSEVLAGAVTVPAGVVVGALGAAAIGWGGWLAARQATLKLLVAYSTVSQLGYLFLIVPLAAVPLAAGAPSAGGPAADGWDGGVLYALSHGIAKAALFLAAGCMVQAARSERIADMTGLGARLTVATFAFAIAGVTLVGLPPTGGFVAKWYLVSSSINGGEPWWAGVILGGSLVTAVYVLAVLRPALAVARHPRRLAPVPRPMEVAAMALALAGVVLGLRPVEALELLAIGRGGS